MASSRAWANAFNIGCTFVVAYALLALAVLHAHKARHGGATEPHHSHHHGQQQHGMARTPNEGERDHHGPCPLEHFAWLALVTGLTGLVAGCTMKRRWMYIFPVALLLTETYALVHISRGAVRAVHECAIRSERVLETVSVDRTDIAPGVSMVREKVAFSKPFMDVQARDECVDGVRHAVLLSCMIIGAICSALMCCGSRLTAARARELQNSTRTVTIVGTEVEERRPLKQDPLEDDDEDIAHGNVVIIRRV